MSNNIKISIIIPVYNCEKYLGECLDSIISFKGEKFECIIVNDGSNDNTKKIAMEYAKKDGRFRVVTKNNEGVSVARNVGVKNAKGEYIFFLDADDYINTKQWGYIIDSTKTGSDYIAFSYYTLFEDGSVKKELFPIDKETKEWSVVKHIALTTPCFNTCWGKLLKRSVIIDNTIEFYKGVKTGEDTIFILDFLKHAQSYLLSNEMIIYYRQHGSSAMHTRNGIDKLNDFKMIYQSRIKMIQEDDDFQLRKDMYRQFFSVLTNLLLECSRNNSITDSIKIYKLIFKLPIVQEIISNTTFKQLSPFFKKIEYVLMKNKCVFLQIVFFKLKGLI